MDLNDQSLIISNVWENELKLDKAEHLKTKTLMESAINTVVIRHIFPKVKWVFEYPGKEWFSKPDITKQHNILSETGKHAVPDFHLRSSEWKCKWWVTWRKTVRRRINVKRNQVIQKMAKDLNEGECKIGGTFVMHAECVVANYL